MAFFVIWYRISLSDSGYAMQYIAMANKGQHTPFTESPKKRKSDKAAIYLNRSENA